MERVTDVQYRNFQTERARQAQPAWMRRYRASDALAPFFLLP